MAHKFAIGIIIVFAVASLSCAKPRNRISKRKLVIDTDAGADDAVAIILALETERLDNGPKVIAITCVNGNADLDDVAINVLKTLKVVDRLDIPVYKGASHPLVLANTKDYFFGRDGFGNSHFPDPPSTDLIKKQHAVIAMIELVQKYPGEITLVVLGPLTNVALAIRLYPSFLDELHELIILGGSVEGQGNVSPGVEFNFGTDPFANYVVFNSTTSKLLTLVPWETTLRTRTAMEFRKSLSKLNNDKVRLIDAAEAVSFKPENEYWGSADAVAMTVALTSKSTVTKSATYYSDAIYDGVKTSGMIIVDYTNITDNPANTNLIQNIDIKVYKELILRSFS